MSAQNSSAALALGDLENLSLKLKLKQQHLQTQPDEPIAAQNTFYNDNGHGDFTSQSVKNKKSKRDQIAKSKVQQNASFEFTEVFVWGDDSLGQLGLYHQKVKKGTLDQKYFKVPKTCSFNIVIKQISCGEQHSAILTNSGHLYMMGSNTHGQLGIGDNCPDFQGQECAGAPCLVDSLRDQKVKRVSCGKNFSFALTATANPDFDQLYAWGQNSQGQLGLSTLRDSSNLQQYDLPTRVQFFTQNGINIKRISAGAEHTLFLTNDGEVYGCGSNSQGQLGFEIQSSTKQLQPIKIEFPESVVIKQISAGQQHSMFLTQEGKVYVCGNNQRNQLGCLTDSTNAFKTMQIEALAKYNITQISVYHTSAAVSDQGELFLWGQGVFGLFKTPQKILTISNPVSQVSLGDTLGSAIDSKGLVWTWGTNQRGELGVGDQEPRVHPYPVLSLKGKSVTSIACGGSYVIALGNKVKKEIPSLKIKKTTEKLSQTRKSSTSKGLKSLSKSKSKKKNSSATNLARKESQSSISRIYAGSIMVTGTQHSPSSRHSKSHLRRKTSKSSLHKQQHSSSKLSVSATRQNPHHVHPQANQMQPQIIFHQRQPSNTTSATNDTKASNILSKQQLKRESSQIQSPQAQQRSSLERTPLNMTHDSCGILPPQHPVNSSFSNQSNANAGNCSSFLNQTTSLNNKEILIRDLQQENKTMRREFEKLKKEHKKALDKMDQMDKVIDKQKVQLANNHEVQMYMSELKRKEQELSVMKLKKDELKRLSKALQDKLDGAQNDRELLNQDYHNLQSQLSDLSLTYQSLQAAHATAQAQLTHQDQEQLAFAQELQMLREHSQQVEQELLGKVQELSGKYKQAIIEKEEVQSLNHQLERNYSDLQSQLKDSQFYQKALEKENAFLREEIEKVKFNKNKEEYSRFLSGLVPLKTKKIDPTSEYYTQEEPLSQITDKTPLQELTAMTNSEYLQPKIIKKSGICKSGEKPPMGKVISEAQENQEPKDALDKKKQQEGENLRMSYNQKLLKSLEKKAYR